MKSPKNRRVIKFDRAYGDLAPFDEHWESETFEEAQRDICAYIERNTGFPPSGNMMYIRVMNQVINEDTRMEELRDAMNHVYQTYGIRAFQISIDRLHCSAQILFDFLDRKRCMAYHLNVTHIKYMMVSLYEYLKLDSYALPDDLTLRSLVVKYDLNNDIFSESIQSLDKTMMGGRSYRVIVDSLRCISNLCKEMSHKRKKTFQNTIKRHEYSSN